MTFAEKVWKSRPDCIHIADLMDFLEDADDIFQETVKECIIHQKTLNQKSYLLMRKKLLIINY